MDGFERATTSTGTSTRRPTRRQPRLAGCATGSTSGPAAAVPGRVGGLPSRRHRAAAASATLCWRLGSGTRGSRRARRRRAGRSPGPPGNARGRAGRSASAAASAGQLESAPGRGGCRPVPSAAARAPVARYEHPPWAAAPGRLPGSPHRPWPRRPSAGAGGDRVQDRVPAQVRRGRSFEIDEDRVGDLGHRSRERS